MTAFPSTSARLGVQALTPDDDESAPTPMKIDREVARGRSTRDPAVDNLRTQHRLSISELNDMDWDQVRDRLAKTTFDERGPVTRFLDLIDLPRNTIAGIVAPGVRRRKEAEGETAAFGQGRVYFSDVLGELGMRPGIARGVLGLVGDLAMDPLTYAGPPGWGVKLATKGGQAVRMGKQFAAASKEAIGAVKAGREIADPLLRGMYHEHVIPKLVAGATDADKAEAFSAHAFGPIKTDIVSRLKTGDIYGLKGAGGEIAESTLRPSIAKESTETAPAVRDWGKEIINRYAEGTPLTPAEAAGGTSPWVPRVTPKGIAFGNGQAAIAHLPFTELGIYVPGKLQAGRMRMAQRVGALAMAGHGAEVGKFLDNDFQTKAIANLSDESDQWADHYVRAASELDQGPAPMPAGRVPVIPEAAAPAVDPERQLISEYIAKHDTGEGTVPARKPYLPTRDKKYADVLNGKTRLKIDTPEGTSEMTLEEAVDRYESLDSSRIASDGGADEGALAEAEASAIKKALLDVGIDFDAPDTALSHIQRGERLGYRPEDIAAYLKKNYPEPVPATPPTPQVPPAPIVPRPGVTPAEFDSESHLFTPAERMQYAKGRYEQNKAAMADLVSKSTEQVNNLIQSKNLSASDVLHLKKKLDAAHALKQGVDADQNAMEMYNALINDKSTGANYLKLKNDLYGEVLKTAEGELDLPGLRARKDAAESLVGPAMPGEDAAAHAQSLALAESQVPAKIEEIRSRAARSVANAILDMPDPKLETLAWHAEGLHRKMQAIANLQNATGGALVANLSNNEQAVADLTKFLLRLDHDSLRTGIFQGMRQAAVNLVGGDGQDNAALQNISRMADLDSGVRRMFGDRMSQMDLFRRAVTRAVETGSPFETDAVVSAVMGQKAKAAIIGHQLKKPEELDKFWTMVAVRAAQQRGELNPGRMLEHVLDKKAGKWVDSDLAAKLKEIQSDGWLGPDRKGLMKEVDEIAKATNEHYDLLGRGMGEAAVYPYAPNRLTPLGAREVAAKGGGALKREGVPGAGGKAVEQFEKSRSQFVYQWEDADGTPHQLDDGDFGHLKVWRDEKGQWTPAFKDLDATRDADQIESIQHLAEQVDSFNRQFPGMTEQGRRLWMGKVADPWYLNGYANSKMRALVGGSKVAENMFSDNALYNFVRRQSEQYSAMARKAFAAQNELYALDLAKETDRTGRYELGKEVTFRGGAKGTILKGSDGKYAIKVGDILYRPLKIDPEALRAEGLMQNVLKERDLVQYFPDQYANMVERAYEVGSSPDNVIQMAKVADKLTNLWKSVTLAHPSWPIFNLMGLIWNTAMGRIPFDLLLKHSKDALRITLNRSDLAALDRSSVLRGQSVPHSQIAVDTDSVAGGGRYGETIQQGRGTFENRYGPNVAGQPSLKERFATKAERLSEDRKARLRMIAREYAIENYKHTTADHLKVIGSMLYDEGFIRKVIGPFMRANAVMEDWYRTAAYMAAIDAGHEPSMAKNLIRETFYDFNDMTGAEANIRRYAIPFFSWMRNNTAYQMRNFLTQPKYAALAPKLREAIEEAIAGEAQVPEHMRPSWMREQLAIQLGSDPKSRMSLSTGTVIPTEPVYQAGGAATGADGMMNLVKWFTSGLNPVLSVPLQLGAGRETFTGRTIGPTEGTGDLSAAEFLGNQIRPLREWAPLGPRTPPGVKAFEKGAGTGLLRATLGGRAQPFDEERLAQQGQRELDDKANSLRNFIRVAETNGDKAASLRGRVKLLSLYKDGLKKGRKVPKWARKALGEKPSAKPRPSKQASPAR